MTRTSISGTGRLTLALLTVVVVALALPAFGVANSATTVFGFATLWLWAVGWGLFGIAVLVWAASRNAFSLSDDQLPPEIRNREVPDGGER